MLLCRRGIFVGHEKTAWLVVFSIGNFFLQASPVSAQDPSMVSAASVPAILEFETSVFDEVREGYVSLAWNSVPDAAGYRVTDSAGGTVYKGEFNQAFISGLTDGSHEFSLTALDVDGDPMEMGVPVAIVNVSHWPMWQAMTSLGIGAVVFVLLIGAIVHGTIAAASGQSNVEDLV